MALSAVIQPTLDKDSVGKLHSLTNEGISFKEEGREGGGGRGKREIRNAKPLMGIVDVMAGHFLFN